MNIRSILVPTDFSDDSKLALDEALDLGRKYGAEIHVLHVVELPMFPAYSMLSMSDIQAPLHGEYAAPKLEKFVEGVGFDRVHTAVMSGHAPQVIVDYATEKGIDLIVIATHGLRGLAHLLMGSTTERVIRMTNCPVLVIRHPDRRVAGKATQEAQEAGIGSPS